MNIFVLDEDVKKCAEYHLDKHSTKMCVEYSQILCSVHHMTAEVTTEVPYRLTHKNHPCSIWARECIENYIWLCDLGLELCKEYTHRYDKRHKSQDVIEWCIINKPNLPTHNKLTPFALAMPDEYKCDNAISSYRKYYMMDKAHLANWTKRKKPFWFAI
jgi:hypothetical protein